MNKIKRIMLLTLLFTIILLINIPFANAYMRGNLKYKTLTPNILDTENLISNENELGVVTDAVVYSKPSSIYEFFDENNLHNIVYATESNIYWSVLNSALNPTQTYSTKVIYTKENVDEELHDITFTVGACTYYKENLYVVYARAPKSPEENALALVKYNKKFKEVDRIEVKAKDINSSKSDSKGGMSFPFYGANCSVAINPKTDVLSVLLGKNRFDGNQDSSILFFDTNNMKWLSDKTDTSTNSAYQLASTHSVMHSLGQRVISTSNGGFLLAESGAFDKTRGLNITQIVPSKLNPLSSQIMFRYKEGKNSTYGTNSTYQALGNIIEVDDGYFYIGASEKTLDTNYGNTINESWNLFVQKYKKTDFQNKTPENLQMFDEPLRKASQAWPKEDKGRLFLNATEIDYGVKWLTDLQNEFSVVFVRAIKIEDDNIVIVWQESVIRGNKNGGFDYDEKGILTYYMIIDSNGNTITPKTGIDHIYNLSVEEQYLYKNGKIYWATASEINKNIVINILDLNRPHTFTYSDIKSYYWYSDAVEYVTNEKIMGGYNNNFKPGEKTNQGTMLLALYCMSDFELAKEIDFSNKDLSIYYNRALKWAIDNQILEDSSINFDDEITKEDIVVLLYKFAKYTNRDISKKSDISKYKDANIIQNYAVSAMQWGIANNMIWGDSNQLLQPNCTVSRADLAVILTNYCKNIGK